MSISFDDVVHVSRLARLDFKENEFEEITEQLGSILNYISSLNELDTKDVLPTSHVLSIKNVFREDIVNSVANTAVIFDTNMEHRGVPSTQDRRLVLNINYFEK